MTSPRIDASLLSLHLPGRALTEAPVVASVRAHEAVNELYDADVRFTVGPSDDLFDGDSVIDQRVEVGMRSGGPSRSFHGIVGSLDVEGVDARGRRVHRIRVVPEIARLGRGSFYRQFQDENVLEIATRVLKEKRIAHRVRTDRTYAKRPHVTQLGESDLAFLRRILAEAGIFFFFDHPEEAGDLRMTGRGGSEVLVLGDSPRAYSGLESLPRLEVREISLAQAMDVPEYGICDVVARRTPAVTRTLMRGYDFVRPNIEVRDTADRGPEKPTIRYDFGGIGDESPPEIDYAAARLDAERRDTFVIEGTGGARRLQIGRRTQIDGHDIASINREVVIAEIHHTAYAAHACPPNTPVYQNRFRAVPSDVALRPPVPPRMVRAVPDTATVVGAAGKEIDVDALGRVLVRPHWQLGGEGEVGSTCRVRVSQALSGPGWGHQWFPRIGMEVVITYLGGDPNQPIISGCVYNATHPPPFGLPAEAATSGIRTETTPGGGGHHEISFDDRKGNERFHMRAERDMDVLVKNDSVRTVHGNEVASIGGNQLLHINGTQTIRIGGKGAAPPSPGAIPPGVTLDPSLAELLKKVSAPPGTPASPPRRPTLSQAGALAVLLWRKEQLQGADYAMASVLNARVTDVAQMVDRMDAILSSLHSMAHSPAPIEATSQLVSLLASASEGISTMSGALDADRAPARALLVVAARDALETIGDRLTPVRQVVSALVGSTATKSGSLGGGGPGGQGFEQSGDAMSLVLDHGLASLLSPIGLALVSTAAFVYIQPAAVTICAPTINLVGGKVNIVGGEVEIHGKPIKLNP